MFRRFTTYLGFARRQPRHRKAARHLTVFDKVLRSAIVVAQMLLVFLVTATLGQNLHPDREGFALAPRTQPTPSLDEQPRRILPAPIDPWNNPNYVISRRNTDSTPVTFSPCRPWRVVVNTTHAPDNGYGEVASALETLQTTTGIQFVLEGTTSEIPSDRRQAYQPDRYGDRWAPILIAWTTDEGGMAGHGGPNAAQGPDGLLHNVSGIITLDGAVKSNAHHNAVRSLLLHEMGHLVGLQHVSDSDQLMYPVMQAEGSQYKFGDLSGLATLGINAPCAPGL